MSQTIDSRVVEMKFDNKNFEKNVAESMKTLEDLSKRVEKLENTKVNLDIIGRAADSFDLSKIDKALDSITNRFSIMGQVGASVIHNLTTDAYNMVKAFGSKTWGAIFGQIKSGGKSRAKNIAEAQFRIEGLGLNYDDYYKSIDDAVTGTAYGFDEAAVAASQFASSGVQAGKDMDHALRGISGMAAMTGRSYTDLAQVMEDAAAAGKVTNDTFGRLAERGLAALQEYAKRTGKSVEEVRKAAQKGEIAFVEFAKVMDEAYGEHATKADETFTGVTSNIRAQLSRIGQAFYEPLITNNSDLIKMFQSVKAQIKELKKLTDPLAESMSNYVLKLARWGKGVIDSIDVSKLQPVFQNAVVIFDNLTKSAENLYTNILKPFGKQFKAAFYEVFPSLNTGKGLLITLSDKLVEASQRFREFTADIGLFGDKGLALKDVLVGILTAIKLVFSVLKNAIRIIKSVLKAIGELTGGLSGAISGLSRFITIVADVGYWIINGLASGLTYGISALMGTILNIGHIIVDTFCKFFGIHSPSRLMIAMVGIPIVAGIAAGILKGFPEVKMAIHKVLSGLIGIVGQIIGTVLTGVSRITVNVFTVLFNTVTNVINAFSNAVNRVNTEKLEKILAFIKNIAIVGSELFILFKVVSAVNSFASAAEEFGIAAKNLAKAVKYWAAQFTIAKLGVMFANFANIFKNLAIAMAVFTGSMLVFSSMIKNGYGWELLESLGIVMLIAGTIGAIVKEVASIDASQLRGAAIGFAGFGAAMWAFASGVKKLGKMEWYEILTAVVSMGLVIGGLAYAAYKMKDSEEAFSQINYKLILGFAAGVWLIASAIKRLSVIPLGALAKAEVAILMLVVVFGAISIALVEVSKLHKADLSDGNFKQLALAFLAFGLAIKMIAKTVIALGFIKQDKLDQGMLAISFIMALMAALMLAAHFVAGEVTAFFVSLAVVVGVMAAAIKVIGDMQAGVTKGIIALVAIMTALGIFIKCVAKIDPDFRSMVSLAFIAAFLGAMTATVKVIGEMDPNALKQGAIALAVMITVLTGIIYLWSKFTGLINGQNNFALVLPDKKEKKKQEESKKNIKDKIKYIKAIAGAVAELAVVAAFIGKIVKSPKEIAVGIGFILLTFAGIMATVNSINKIGGDKYKSLKGMASAIRAIALVIITLGGTLILLSNMPIEGMIAGAIAIGGVIWVIGKEIIERAKVFGIQGVDPKRIYASAAIIIAVGAAMTAVLYIAQDASPWLVLAVAAAISLCIRAIGKALNAAKDFKIDESTGKSLMMAAGALLIVAGAIAIISQFEWETYKVGLGAAVGCIAAFALIISLMSKFGGDNLESSGKALLISSLSMLAIAGAIAIIAQFDWEDYYAGLIAAAGCIAGLGVVVLFMGKFAGNNAIAGATSMVLVAAAMAVASLSIAVLAQFDWEDYKAGLITMSICLGILTGIAGIIAYFTYGAGVIAGAASMAIVAGSMVIAAISIAILAQYDWEDYVGSLIAMSTALTVLSAVAALIGFFSVGLVLTGAASMAIVAGAMIVAAGSIAILSQFEWEDYKDGLIGMSVALGVLSVVAAAVGFFSIGYGAITGAAAMAIVAGSMIVAAGSIAILAQFDWEDYKDGLLWMSVALGVLSTVAAAIGFFSVGYGAITGAASMAIVAGAMVVAATSIAILAQFDWADIQNSIIGLGSALAILTIIAGSLGGKDAILGATAMAIVAGSVVILAIAFRMFAEVVAEFFTVEKANEIVAFFNTLSDGIPAFAESLSANLQTAVETLRTNVPPLKEELNKLVDDVADAMTELAKKVQDRGVEVATAMGEAVNAIKSVIKEEFGIASPSKFMSEIGMWLMEGLKQGIMKFIPGPIKTIVSAGKMLIEAFRDIVGVHSRSTVFYDIGSWLFPGVTDAMKDSQNPMFEAAKTAGKGLVDSFKEGAKDLLSGEVKGSFTDALNDIFKDLDIEALKNGDVSGLLSGFLQNGISIDSLGGDSLNTLIDKLKDAGIAGDGLNDILKALGISLDGIVDEDLRKKLGLDDAKEGAEELKTTIQDLADEIIKGKFGNAPERWDRMFEALIKSGKTAEEAYAAIADAQNEVNKRLGNSTVHTAEEMSKKVSESVKKANQAQAEANAKAKGETGKPGRDFNKDPHKAVTDTSASDAAKAAEEQMKRNMPYANYMAAKEQQITGERQKQTAEAMKQKLANEHLYTLKEKEQAIAGLKANQELAANATLSTEKQKQLDAENRKYQAVVDTYNKQQDMLKVIQEQEAATKKAEEAEKKRGEAAAKATTGVQYGSAEYEKQKKGTTINNRKTIVKQETKPVQAETKVEMTPKLEVKNIDVTQYKEQIVAKVESQVKELNSKVDITPKINTSQAETQIANFKQKTQELKTSIPQTFEGIAQKVSEHFTKISSMVITGGGKLTANTRSVFQNAVAAATGVLTGPETISKFYNAGKQATQGYINGMKSNISGVKTASSQLGVNSAKTVKQSLGIKSPSRVFMQIGEYAAEGYIVGIEKYTGAVETASNDLSQSSIDGIYRIVDAVQNAVSNGMDITPTITPVFDAGNIQNELGNVNSMMDFSQRDLASITANIDAKASYDNSQVEAMQSRMSDMQDAFNNLADILNNQPTPEVNAHVILQGDADGVFKLVQNSNNRYTKMHGKSAFA